MAKPIKRSKLQPKARRSAAQTRNTGKLSRPVARWRQTPERRLLVLENSFCRVEVCPEQGGAITSYVDRATGIDIMWRNPYGQPPRTRVLDQPMGAGSDLFDVMDGSWYVSIPNGFFACDYFGAPLGTHGELRCVPWYVTDIRRITPARTVAVFKTDQPELIQLQAGYSGKWPHVPERIGGAMRDCSIVPPADSGRDHSVQLRDFEAGWGCIWNEKRGLGFSLQWDLATFPEAWSWCRGGGPNRYPLWGEGHIITLQPSSSPVGRFADLLRAGQLPLVPAKGELSTVMHTGFVKKSEGPWA
jgi:hypothetical protein